MIQENEQEITLIVEDHYGQRLSLHQSLEYRGFNVVSAGDVRTTRDLIAKWRDKFDVVVLDMRLEDKEYPGIIGTDIGLELLSMKPKRRPEFLIISGFSLLEYYIPALDLGVAAYLHKGECRVEDLIRNIRALKLRRALNPDQYKVQTQIEQIIETSRSTAEVIILVCRKILEKPLRDFLGAPFAFLIKENSGSHCCGGNAELPQVFDPIYNTIQALAFAEVRTESPYQLDSDKIPNKTASPLANQILPLLDNAAFLNFRISSEVLLSIGILQADKKQMPLAEDPKEMAKVLSQYFKSEMLELILNILSKWKEKETHRKTLLRAIAEFCLYTGQRQLDILEEDENSDPQFVFDKLRVASNDLRDTGNLLNTLVKREALPNEDDVVSKVVPKTIMMSKFIKNIWNDLGYPNEDSLTVIGDCVVRAEETDMLIVFSRLLSWFAQRFIETPDGRLPQIIVKCEQTTETSELIFEDCSRRLPDALRELLFQPFSHSLAPLPEGESLLGSDLALYLVKVIVETKLYGLLEDRSDELAEETAAESSVPTGHRFVIRFRFPNDML